VPGSNFPECEKQMSLQKRELEGLKIVAKGDQIRSIDESCYLVRSQSHKSKWYKVMWNRKRWMCNCSDYIKRKPSKCKHVHALNYYTKVRQLTLGLWADEAKCPKCKTTRQVIRRGVRYNRSEPVQRYYCKRHKLRFSGRTGFKGMKTISAAIVIAMDLYYKGLSLRKIADHLHAFYGIKITHGTVYNWIVKYVQLINRHVADLRPRLSECWHADETVVSVSGRHLNVWGLLDDETRFLIASHVSRGRRTRDARLLLRRGLRLATHRPREFVTDGLASYSKAAKAEFIGSSDAKTIHLQGPFAAPKNNSKMERFNGTLKDRTKPVRHFHSTRSAALFANGFRLYYNFIKPHRGLGGRTPAQAAQVVRKGRRNRWLELIRASSRKRGS
jgi:transposase-like protein